MYDKIGGKAAMKTAVDRFYARVLDDKSLRPFFEGTDMEVQRSKQAAFLAYALGGVENWKGKNMLEAHKHLTLTEDDFGAVARHLEDTLEELGVAGDVIADAMSVVAGTKDDVLGHCNPDESGAM